MEEKTQVVDHVQLPFLTNPKALKAGEQLVVLKPTEDQGNAEGAPKKKPKSRLASVSALQLSSCQW
jgi:hypothetical protein